MSALRTTCVNGLTYPKLLFPVVLYHRLSIPFVGVCRFMGAIGKEENIEEVLAPIGDVFSIMTDTTLAQTWGITHNGALVFPNEGRMRLGQIVDVRPKGMKEPLKVKVKLIHQGEFVEMEIVEGPMFGVLKFALENRPYGTLLTSVLDYRIESIGFNLKWKLTERKRYREMMGSILSNIKVMTESKPV